VRARSDGRATLCFDEAVWSPAPGQAAVVWDAADERMLGGGWIAAAG
jgi:tRNA U34 2-thiouridine synthase MnmA/TrmU